MTRLVFVFLFILFYNTHISFAENGMRTLMSANDTRLNDVFLGQSLNTRLDMIDYFDARSEKFTPDDLYSSKIRIDALEDRHVRFASDTPITVDMYLLTPGTDSLIVSVTDIPIGNGDATIDIFDIKTGEKIDSPTLKYSDWLKKDAFKEVGHAELSAAIPFITASVTVDTASDKIILKNTAIDVPGLEKRLVNAFKPSVTLGWTGKKFVMNK